MIDVIRVSAIGFLLAVIGDVYTFFILIVLFGMLNFVVGLIAGLAQGEHYSHRKAFHAFFEYAIAAVVITFTAAGARLIEPTINYMDLLRLLTTLFALVYAKNIVRNFKIIQPDNEFIGVLDTIINTKYMDLIKKLKKDETFLNKRTDTFVNSEGEGDKQCPQSSDNGESDKVS